MKHIFIINPHAGNVDPSIKLVPQIHSIFSSREQEYEIHLTTGKGDAIQFVKNRCEDSSELLRFYACGGDGTLNEVVNGVYGYDHVSVASVPCGSGNDFIKSLPSFSGLEKLIDEGQEHSIDLIDVNGRLCVNLTCMGFDADVNYSANKYKKLPFVKGGTSYNLAIIERFFCRMGHQLTVEFDNGEVIEGRFLLSVFANGQYYGGQFRGAPLAVLDDGLIDVGLVRTLPRAKIVQLIGYYSRGEHVNNPLFKDIVVYRKTPNVTVTCDHPLILNQDGEMFTYPKIEFRILRSALSFVVMSEEYLTLTKEKELVTAGN